MTSAIRPRALAGCPFVKAAPPELLCRLSPAAWKDNVVVLAFPVSCQGPLFQENVNQFSVLRYRKGNRWLPAKRGLDVEHGDL